MKGSGHPPGGTSQVLPHPREHLVQPALAVQSLPDEVPFVREHERPARHTVPAQHGKELQSLIHRDAVVELVGDHQRRRLDVLGEQMGR
jgi:hypothetical protein